MQAPLKFTWVRTKEQWEQMKPMCCGHSVDDSTQLPILLVYRGETLVAFFSVITAPVLIPCFDPHCSPRDFKEISERVISWQEIANQTSHADPFNRFPFGQSWFAFEESPVIDEKILNKLGMKKHNAVLWETMPK